VLPPAAKSFDHHAAGVIPQRFPLHSSLFLFNIPQAFACDKSKKRSVFLFPEFGV
jgi:hypothetical protein